jgi:hypothetical protein
MSKLTASASLHKGSRPVSASAVPEASYNTTTLSAKDGRKRRIGTLSVSNNSEGNITVQSSQPTGAGFSSSLDEESGLEELLPRLATQSFSLLSSSFEPTQDYSKNKSITKGQRSSSTPKINLKPRPPRRSSASIRSRENGCRTMMPSSFKSPPPKIFIPFLPSQNKYYSRQYQKQPQQKALPPPPLIPQLTNMHSPSNPTTTDGSRTRQSWSDPLPLQRQKKTKWTRSVSTTLSSPPQLITSFDYSISAATTRDAITPPPIPIRPLTPLTTPPSIICTNTLLLMRSVEALHKNSGGKIVAPAAVVAKPIARRLVITPSNRHNNKTNRTCGSSPFSDAFFSLDDDRTPHHVFPTSMSNHNSDGGAASLSSSVESSFSSAAPPSSMSTTIQRSTRIRRPLSTDEDDRLLRGATSF